LAADGSYSFKVSLIASRNGNGQGGRQYLIDVTAKDYAGNVGGGACDVLVPHDQGH
jgi:hypothetical protein